MNTLPPLPAKPESRDLPLPDDISRLEDAVRHLPEEYQSKIVPYLEQVVLRTKRRQNTMTLLQEAFAQLRLDMKYLIFDLEATTHERDMYRTS